MKEIVRLEEVSPYGSSEKYKLKVAGVVRSVSESIVITTEYADALRISYTIDSVYTDAEKNGIAADSAIKNVLSKMPTGIGVLAYLLKELAGEYEMRMAVSVATIVYSIVLTVGMSLLVSLMVSGKNKKIDMVEALKGAE